MSVGRGVMTKAAVEEAETDHPRAAELREFLDLHYRRVVGAVGLISGNRDLAEDAVQEAIVRAWKRRDEPVERLVGWITVVAVNQVRADLRRAGSEQRAADRLGRRDDAAAAHVDPAPADEELWVALRSLPEREREAGSITRRRRFT